MDIEAVRLSKMALHASSLAAEGNDVEARHMFLQLFADHRAIHRALPNGTSVHEVLHGLCAQLGCLLEAGEQKLAAVLWQEALAEKRRGKMQAAEFNAITSKLRERKRYGTAWRKDARKGRRA